MAFMYFFLVVLVKRKTPFLTIQAHNSKQSRTNCILFPLFGHLYLYT
jgi:hypothetical protein